MTLAISLITLLALLLQAHHTRKHRTTHRNNQQAHLRRRLNALELELPRLEAEFGASSASARYVRAARYLTSLELRHLTPRRQAGRTAIGGTR